MEEDLIYNTYKFQMIQMIMNILFWFLKTAEKMKHNSN